MVRNYPGGDSETPTATSNDDAVTMLRAIAQNLSALVEATAANAPVPGAPINAQYIVGALDGTLTADRLVTDSATIAWDLAAPAAAAASVVDDSISNAKLANMVQATIKGRASGAGTGDPTDLTGTQVAVILPDASTTQRGVVEIATDAEIRAAAASPANAVIAASAIETASAFVTLTDASTITWSWDAGINLIVTMAGNRTLAMPSDAQIGTWRTIWVQSDSATLRQLSFDGNCIGKNTAITGINNGGNRRLISIYALSATVGFVCQLDPGF